MKRTAIAIVFLFALTIVAKAQQPNRKLAIPNWGPVSNLKVAVWYVLHADSSNLSGYDIEMFIHNAPHIFRLAMATHHEYDDRFWRYVENFRVESDSGKACSFARQDSALWAIFISGKDAVIKYRIHLPVQTSAQRASHRPFLTSKGGLVGGIQSFMYIVGQTSVSSHVTFQLPAGWEIATGLAPTNKSNTFFAPDATFLLDCPVLAGQLWDTYFYIDGVPHRIVYWPRAQASLFDTLALKKSIKKMVQQAANLFGSVPYRDYTFLLQDNAFGALEHLNSVTIGAPHTALTSDITNLDGEIAHEFFHTWNLMRIKPVEYSDLNYGPQEQSAGLWWSEGLTMFYADLILRRAGLPVYDSTRVSHLEQLITRYFASPGNTHFSPEQVSLVSNKPPGPLGDYSASVHLQGELIGAMLDLIIRGATNGRSSIDEAMRKMFDRYPVHGFSENDIENTLKDICKCDVHGFFESYVYGNKIMNFNKYLGIVGLNLTLSWVEARNTDGSLAPDMRVYSWQADDGAIRIGITDPLSCWGRAGLHTGDKIIALNNKPVKSTKELRTILNGLHIGDKSLIEIQRPAGKWQTFVLLQGYKNPEVVIRKNKVITVLQSKLFDVWFAGNN